MTTKIPTLICQCGCGEVIPPVKRHRYPSKRAKYKMGHSHRNKFHLNRDTVEMEYLAAGSAFKLAKKYGISPVAVYNMLKKVGVKTLPKEHLGDCEQKTGRKWELKCLEELKGSLDVSGLNWKSPYDIEWNGFKINVKVSNPVSVAYSEDKPAWSFNTVSKKETDYFLCIGLGEGESIEKIFWIPSEEAKKQTTIRRNGNTKYEKYKTTFKELNDRELLT
jgi:hypothetical protein